MAAVALAACLESLVFEILDMAVEIVYTLKKKRIFPNHLQKVVEADKDLHTLFKDNKLFISRMHYKKNKNHQEMDKND